MAQVARHQLGDGLAAADDQHGFAGLLRLMQPPGRQRR